MKKVVFAALLLGPVAGPARGQDPDAEVGSADFAAQQLDIERRLTEIEGLVARLRVLRLTYPTTPDLEALRLERQGLSERANRELTQLYAKVGHYDKSRQEFEFVHMAKVVFKAKDLKQTLPPRQFDMEKRKTKQAIADGRFPTAFTGLYDFRQSAVDAYARCTRLRADLEQEQAAFEKEVQAREKSRQRRAFWTGCGVCLLLLACLALAWRRLRTIPV